jgi:hypothetical protein
LKQSEERLLLVVKDAVDVGASLDQLFGEKSSG